MLDEPRAFFEGGTFLLAAGRLSREFAGRAFPLCRFSKRRVPFIPIGLEAVKARPYLAEDLIIALGEPRVDLAFLFG